MVTSKKFEVGDYVVDTYPTKNHLIVKIFKLLTGDKYLVGTGKGDPWITLLAYLRHATPFEIENRAELFAKPEHEPFDNDESDVYAIWSCRSIVLGSFTTVEIPVKVLGTHVEWDEETEDWTKRYARVEVLSNGLEKLIDPKTLRPATPEEIAKYTKPKIMIQLDKEYQTRFGLPVKLAHIEGWVPRSWDTASGKVGGLVDRKWCLVEKKATKEIDFWLIIERDGRYWITPDPKYDDGVGFARIHIKQTVVEGQTE